VGHVEGLRASFTAAAEAALGRMVAACEDLGLHVTALGLAARAPRPAPRLEEILKSHALIHSAEGDFYAGVWSAAMKRLGLPAARLSEAEALEALAGGPAGDAGDIGERLKEMGRALGPPWTAEERAAAAAAWAALNGLSQEIHPAAARAGP
jgi:hypothetical protein